MKEKKIVNFVCGYLDAMRETDELLVTRLAGRNRNQRARSVRKHEICNFVRVSRQGKIRWISYTRTAWQGV
jgi:hypothetical protein